ncbi:MAG: MerR family transcriptional regulator [Flavobacteriaceae bacterium]|nr:MerR family transcriptional regulator [Flavobacteriaceae bacterium]
MEIKLKDKLYYSIGEVSKAFGVNTSLLRFWEKEFKELNPKKKSNGIRKYSPNDIKTLKTIHYLLKDKKMTIEGAKNNLKIEKDKINNHLKILDKLNSIKNQLEKIKSNL